MKLLFAFVMLFSSTVNATGKLTLQNNLYDDGKVYRPIVGLSIYEKLYKNTALNMWTGYGIQSPEYDDLNWFVAKAQIDLQFKKLTVAPGIQYKNIISSDRYEINPYFKIDYVLW